MSLQSTSESTCSSCASPADDEVGAVVTSGVGVGLPVAGMEGAAVSEGAAVEGDQVEGAHSHAPCTLHGHHHCPLAHAAQCALVALAQFPATLTQEVHLEQSCFGAVVGASEGSGVTSDGSAVGASVA